MASSIKIRDETKAELDRLQARLTLKLGRKISQQDLLDMLVKLGSRDFQQLLDFNFTTSSSIDKVLSLSSEWKIRTDPEMLDDLVAEG
ncbi:MAG: hypothetical protein D6732_11160 [Methanobacteriota archaeon]|nr:MAG: hypothetical protein D6732_11160 [Euryarchaeota archaeon]